MKSIADCINEGLLDKKNIKDISLDTPFIQKYKEFLDVMGREGFSYDYESYKNQIRFYWRGSQHWLGNVVFIIYLNNDNTLDYIDWLSNKDLKPRYEKIIINVFKR